MTRHLATQKRVISALVVDPDLVDFDNCDIRSTPGTEQESDRACHKGSVVCLWCELRLVYVVCLVRAVVWCFCVVCLACAASCCVCCVVLRVLRCTMCLPLFLRFFSLCLRCHLNHDTWRCASTPGAPQARESRLAHTWKLRHNIFAPHAKLALHFSLCGRPTRKIKKKLKKSRT